MPNNPLERVRRLCLALPEANERLSHGEPTFFVHLAWELIAPKRLVSASGPKPPATPAPRK
jgi:hypothetical protein